MTKTERAANQRGAISIFEKRREQIRGQKILLLDDVLTTGATMSACTEACLDVGAKEVNVLVLARVARLD